MALLESVVLERFGAKRQDKDNLFREAASNVSSCSTWQLEYKRIDPPVRRESVLAGKPVGHFFAFFEALRRRERSGSLLPKS